MAKAVIEKKDSPFASALCANRKKKIGANALDYFLLLIVSVLLFLLLNLAVEAFPSVKNKQSEISSLQEEMISLVEDSKLGEYENGEYKSNEEIANSYLYRLTYRSLLEGGIKEENITSSITSIYKPIEKSSDNLFSYYVYFKTSNISSYSLIAEEKEECGEAYYLSILSKDLGISFKINDGYPLLEKEEALSIQDYVLDSSFAPGKEIFATLKERYQTLLESSIEEFESEYLPFKSKMEAHEALKNSLYGVRRAEIGVSYLLGSAICYLLLPLLLKNGRTVSCKAMNLAYCRKDKKEVAFSNLLIRFLVLLVEFMSVCSLIPFIIYGSSAIDLLYLPFLGGISLLMCALFSFLFMLFSFLSSFIDKESESTTSEFISSLLLKDITQFASKSQKKETADGK